MKTTEFLHELEHDRIAKAICDAEKKTSGEIRVFITRNPVEAPVTEAQAHFLRLGMDKTRDRNGVLIFVAPKSQKFAIVGDIGVHTRCGDSFWLELAAEMTNQFKHADFTKGILEVVHRAGDLLAVHFPRRPDDQNELSDEVAHD